MSTKCTIFYQNIDSSPDIYDGEIHVYWDMGVHRPAGYYVEVGEDVVRIREPRKLLEALEKALNAVPVRDA